MNASFIEKLVAGDPEAEKEYRRILTAIKFSEEEIRESLARLRSDPGPSRIEKLLNGDPEAEKEYRRDLTSSLLALDEAFVVRLLKGENLAKLNEAQRIGINPDSIMTQCIRFAKKTWSEPPMRSPTEAKEVVRELGRIKKDLRRLLRRTALPMSDVPIQGEPSSPLPVVPSTAPQPSVLGRFWLHDSTSMRALWKVVGRGEEKGLLGDLADAIEAAIPAIKTITPAHRPERLGEKKFALEWNRLARYGAKSPCHELGTWFFEVTFGEEITVEAFAKLIKRPSPS